MLVRRAVGVTSVREACSIGRNGPTSAPDGLITPIVAATSRIANEAGPANEPPIAKTAPAAAISSAPITRVRRRPIRSAWVVSHRLINVSPTRVRVSRIPIAPGSRPSDDRYRTRMTPIAP